MEKRDNYQIQMEQAKKRFLTYDQQELIRRCAIPFDQSYLYLRMLSRDYRICRTTGDMACFYQDRWQDANRFAEVMILLDWLCDSRSDRYITGRWINLVNQGYGFHRELQEREDPNAWWFDRHTEEFCTACEKLGGRRMPGGDVGYAIELLDGLELYIQLWHSDEEFPAKLHILWEENTTCYIRYETTWYALGLVLRRIREEMA